MNLARSTGATSTTTTTTSAAAAAGGGGGGVQMSSLTEKLATFREQEKAAAAGEDGMPDLTVYANEKDTIDTIDTRDANANGKKDKKEDPSRLMGEKLMQGWAMMEQTCPLCNAIPLMQDKKKQVYIYGIIVLL
jgi:hypothetical protein